MRSMKTLARVIAPMTLLIVTSQALAQSFPAKPVRLVVPFSSGSQTDMVARTLAPKLSDAWGQPVMIENKSGAGGVLGADTVRRATADGHTLLLTSSSFSISAAAQRDLPYVPARDFVGVTQIGFTTTVLVATPALGAKSVKELVALAHGRPGKLLWGSAGVGSGTYMSGEIINMAAAIKATHVGFKGQPEFIVEILAGRIHYAAAGLGPALPFIKDGRLIALGVSTPERSPVLPDVPTLAEELPGYEKEGSYTLLAPSSTPPAVRERISTDIARVLAIAEVAQKLQSFGFLPSPSTPDECDRIVRAQIETFSKVLRLAGLRGP